jgi:hypothetical protein
MEPSSNVSALVSEYRTLFDVSADTSDQRLQAILVREGDWSPLASEHILKLARDYGSFVLRNALAVSLALDIEDGALGI